MLGEFNEHPSIITLAPGTGQWHAAPARASVRISDAACGCPCPGPCAGASEKLAAAHNLNAHCARPPCNPTSVPRDEDSSILLPEATVARTMNRGGSPRCNFCNPAPVLRPLRAGAQTTRRRMKLRCRSARLWPPRPLWCCVARELSSGATASTQHANWVERATWYAIKLFATDRC